MSKPKKKTTDESKAAVKRDAKGRFVNSPGPGRPPAQREVAYLRSVREAVTPEQVAELAIVLLQKAMKGDVPAAKLLLEHLLPKPTERMRIEQEFAVPWEAEELQEFRVAGKSVEELDAAYLHWLAAKVRQRQAARAAEATTTDAMQNHLRPRAN